MSTKTIKEKLNVRVQVILQMIYHWENLLLYKLHLYELIGREVWNSQVEEINS